MMILIVYKVKKQPTNMFWALCLFLWGKESWGIQIHCRHQGCLETNITRLEKKNCQEMEKLKRLPTFASFNQDLMLLICDKIELIYTCGSKFWGMINISVAGFDNKRLQKILFSEYHANNWINAFIFCQMYGWKMDRSMGSVVNWCKIHHNVKKPYI